MAFPFPFQDYLDKLVASKSSMLPQHHTKNSAFRKATKVEGEKKGKKSINGQKRSVSESDHRRGEKVKNSSVSPWLSYHGIVVPNHGTVFSVRNDDEDVVATGYGQAGKVRAGHGQEVAR